MSCYLGIDVGSSKTEALVVDATGRVIGAARGGAGNHETVGYDGLEQVLRQVSTQALAQAGQTLDQVVGAGLGLAGLDWDLERADHLARIRAIGLTAPVMAVNDALIGLVAGAAEGWGIAVVSGTGCNCWGWDRERRWAGHMTGGGLWMGEAAGATELMARVVVAVSHAWTRRGPTTRLTDLLLEHTGAADPTELFYGLMDARYRIPASLAPRVFALAEDGDAVAQGLIEWAGGELGEMVNAVARQLNFEALTFDVVMLGSLFNGGARLINPMRERVSTVAPHAHFVRLEAPPVAGAALLGLEQGGVEVAPLRERVLAETRTAFG